MPAAEPDPGGTTTQDDGGAPPGFHIYRPSRPVDGPGDDPWRDTAVTAGVTGLLVVTAVEAEADAVRAGLDGRSTVAAVGVGPAAAAAGTARLLALAEAGGRPYHGA